MTKAYEINEKDIDSTINYLKTVDPENATPEMAIAFLEQLQASVHMMAHDNPVLLKNVQRDLEDR